MMEKSKDLSNISVGFYKKSKKANSRCCILIWCFFIVNLIQKFTQQNRINVKITTLNIINNQLVI